MLLLTALDDAISGNSADALTSNLTTQLNYDILIIGGGFFGAYISVHFARLGKRVVLCEREPELMQRASLHNQARVHNGYHYPRSTLTALRSHIDFPRFVGEFEPAIDASFDKYYLIGRIGSHVTSRQFETFCKRIGAPCSIAPEHIRNLANPALIEASYSVTEYAFNSTKLRQLMHARLEKTGVIVKLGASVESVMQAGSKLRTKVKTSDDTSTIDSDQVFNCTYAMLNHVNARSTLPSVPLRHELTEICLVDVPEELDNAGITLMCGPFFSVMPYPVTGQHSFSHVRYTPHFSWRDERDRPTQTAISADPRGYSKSHWNRIRRDSQRYLPLLGQCEYKTSMWEVKTILPSREVDDGRPILFSINHGIKGYHCLMGGKIDNVYDIVDTIRQRGLDV